MADPSGDGYEPVDEAIGIGFVLYDAGKLGYDAYTHAPMYERAADGIALGLDGAGPMR